MFSLKEMTRRQWKNCRALERNEKNISSDSWQCSNYEQNTFPVTTGCSNAENNESLALDANFSTLYRGKGPATNQIMP
jgi:hypothetical protein